MLEITFLTNYHLDFNGNKYKSKYMGIGSFGVCLGPSLSLLSPLLAFETICCRLIERHVWIWYQQQLFNFANHFQQSFGGSPLISDADHFRANLSLLADVGVEDLGQEGNLRSFERKIVEFELDFEISALKR